MEQQIVGQTQSDIAVRVGNSFYISSKDNDYDRG